MGGWTAEQLGKILSIEGGKKLSRLGGKVALITGSGSGMGRATAVLFAKEGAKIVAVDWMVKEGEETVKMIEEAGGEAIFVRANVAESADVQRMVRTAVDTFGRLDILFNNAAVLGELRPIVELTEEEWDRVLDIDLKGVFLGMKYGIHEMLESGGGVIINNASSAGVRASSRMSAYGSAKAGVIHLTKVAALEYATQNIRVNCIVPAAIRPSGLGGALPKGKEEEILKQVVQGVPMQRTGKPEEIAQVVLFLASDESSFVTGAALYVDGGSLAGLTVA
jgi:NAD(P)-dependent dehydrogenase (short-subunit alcohol dehydrogenase family)